MIGSSILATGIEPRQWDDPRSLHFIHKGLLIDVFSDSSWCACMRAFKLVDLGQFIESQPFPISAEVAEQSRLCKFWVQHRRPKVWCITIRGWFDKSVSSCITVETAPGGCNYNKDQLWQFVLDGYK